MQNESNALIYFSVKNVNSPQIHLLIDDMDISQSPDITVETLSDGVDVLVKPALSEGVHTVRCIVTNQQSHRQTALSRTFWVHSLSPGYMSSDVLVAKQRDGLKQIETHEQLKSILQTNSAFHSIIQSSSSSSSFSVYTSFALEYPTSARTALLMKTDWSSLMPILNVLILLVIFLCYWGCRMIGLSILHRQVRPELLSKLADKGWSWLFPTNRVLKLSLLRDYFRGWNPVLREFFCRLFLFTTDDCVFWSVIITLVGRVCFPRFGIDQAVGKHWLTE